MRQHFPQQLYPQQNEEISQCFLLAMLMANREPQQSIRQWHLPTKLDTSVHHQRVQLLRDYIQIVSWIYPGATVRHARLGKHNKLEEKVEYVLALRFLPIVCQYFILHSNSSRSDKKQPTKYIVVIPEVTNLRIDPQRCWGSRRLDYKDFHVTSYGEAALKYYSYRDIDEKPSDEAAGRSLFAVECRSHDSSCWKKIRKSTMCDTVSVWLSSMEKTSRKSRHACNWPLRHCFAGAWNPEALGAYTGTVCPNFGCFVSVGESLGKP